MNDEKKFTERDLILAKREAASFALNYFKVYEPTGPGREAQKEFVASQFPLPKVTRPRVLKIDGGEYRVINDNLEVRIASASWQRPGWTVEEITALADLIANPTEEVGADS